MAIHCSKPCICSLSLFFECFYYVPWASMFTLLMEKAFCFVMCYQFRLIRPPSDVYNPASILSSVVNTSAHHVLQLFEYTTDSFITDVTFLLKFPVLSLLNYFSSFITAGGFKILILLSNYFILHFTKTLYFSTSLSSLFLFPISFSSVDTYSIYLSIFSVIFFLFLLTVLWYISNFSN